MTDALATQEQQGLDVQALISQALEKNADPSTLERFVGLAERMLALQARREWVAAMTRAQQEFPTIEKSAEAKTAGYSYKYAPLDEIDQAIKPVLHKHQLVMTWQYDCSRPGEVGANCRITHALGHAEDSGFLYVPIEPARADGKGATPAQRAGIAATYARRYSCCAVTGIVPHGEDPDGKDPGGIDDPPAEKRSDGSALVAGVEKSTGTNAKTGKPWTRYMVSFADGRAGSTFDEKLATEAEQAHRVGAYMIPSLEKSGQYVNLMGLVPAGAPPGEEAPIEGTILISEKDQKKLLAVIRGSGWGATDQEQQTALHDMLARHQITHVKDIPAALFEDILNVAKAGPKK